MTAIQLLSLTLTFLVAGAGAYIGSYLHEKGKGLATKEDIGRITEIVEQVKTDIGQQDWAKREWTNLRRLKLEEYLNHAHGIVRYVEATERSAGHGKLSDLHDPRAEFQTLGSLYFPELREEQEQFIGATLVRIMSASYYAEEMIKARTGMADPKTAHTTFTTRRDVGAIADAQIALRQAARALLLRIMPASGGDTEA
jgi:hypothetical protein